MLESYKRSYEQCADRIPDWKKMSKNELINKYVEVEVDHPDLAEAYLSAIIVKYWNTINKYYITSHKSASLEDCYEWLIHGITYALQHKRWLDKDCSVHQDPNGPDKVVNRCLMSARLGYFQSSNAARRRVNFNSASLEALLEDLGDAAPFPLYEDQELENCEFSIKDLVVNAFNNEEYLLAFMIDGIVNYDPFETERGEDGYLYTQFNERKLARHLRALNDTYCSNFASIFKVDREKVSAAIQDCKSLSRVRLHTAIKRNLRALRKNKAIVDTL